MKKFFAWATLFFFAVMSLFGYAPATYAQFALLVPGTMVTLTAPFQPLVLTGIKIDPQNPLRFDFIIDQGDVSAEQVQEESTHLIKYFLASLTTPEDDLWVNLSPFEEDRIIPASFGMTEMGRDLLAQDYLLKQLTSSLMYPQEELGESFWRKVHDRVFERYGNTDVAVDTFNKVWIVPQKAVVYEGDGVAYVVESKLKVMLEEDYAALNEQYVIVSDKKADGAKAIGREAIREMILPAIEQEVNEGEHFAKLRQIYSALILATWYKRKMQSALLNQVYSDQNKTAGVDHDNPKAAHEIWQQYVKTLQEGVYDFIKEDYDPQTQKVIPRRYFSGGASLALTDEALVTTNNPFLIMKKIFHIGLAGLMVISTILAPPDGIIEAAEPNNEPENLNDYILVESGFGETRFLTETQFNKKLPFFEGGSFYSPSEEILTLIDQFLDGEVDQETFLLRLSSKKLLPNLLLETIVRRMIFEGHYDVAEVIIEIYLDEIDRNDTLFSGQRDGIEFLVKFLINQIYFFEQSRDPQQQEQYHFPLEMLERLLSDPEVVDLIKQKNHSFHSLITLIVEKGDLFSSQMRQNILLQIIVSNYYENIGHYLHNISLWPEMEDPATRTMWVDYLKGGFSLSNRSSILNHSYKALKALKWKPETASDYILTLIVDRDFTIDNIDREMRRVVMETMFSLLTDDRTPGNENSYFDEIMHIFIDFIEYVDLEMITGIIQNYQPSFSNKNVFEVEREIAFLSNILYDILGSNGASQGDLSSFDREFVIAAQEVALKSTSTFIEWCEAEERSVDMSGGLWHLWHMAKVVNIVDVFEDSFLEPLVGIILRHQIIYGDVGFFLEEYTKEVVLQRDPSHPSVKFMKSFWMKQLGLIAEQGAWGVVIVGRIGDLIRDFELSLSERQELTRSFFQPYLTYLDGDNIRKYNSLLSMDIRSHLEIILYTLDMFDLPAWEKDLLVNLGNRFADMQWGDLSYERMHAIYAFESFQRATEDLSSRQRFIVGRAVDIQLKRWGVPIGSLDGQQIEKLVVFTRQVRDFFGQRVLVGPGSGVAHFSHNEPYRFLPDGKKRLFEGMGADFSPYRGPEQKKNMLEAFEDLDISFYWLEGHGGDKHFWLADGQVGEQESDDLRNPNALSYLEIAEALIRRAEKTGGDLSGVTIILDSCLSGNCIVNAFRELENNLKNNSIGQGGEIKLPTLVSSAHVGTFSFSQSIPITPDFHGRYESLLFLGLNKPEMLSGKALLDLNEKPAFVISEDFERFKLDPGWVSQLVDKGYLYQDGHVRISNISEVAGKLLVDFPDVETEKLNWVKAILENAIRQRDSWPLIQVLFIIPLEGPLLEQYLKLHQELGGSSEPQDLFFYNYSPGSGFEKESITLPEPESPLFITATFDDPSNGDAAMIAEESHKKVSMPDRTHFRPIVKALNRYLLRLQDMRDFTITFSKIDAKTKQPETKPFTFMNLLLEDGEMEGRYPATITVRSSVWPQGVVDLVAEHIAGVFNDLDLKERPDPSRDNRMVPFITEESEAKIQARVERFYNAMKAEEFDFEQQLQRLESQGVATAATRTMIKDIMGVRQDEGMIVGQKFGNDNITVADVQILVAKHQEGRDGFLDEVYGKIANGWFLKALSIRKIYEHPEVNNLLNMMYEMDLKEQDNEWFVLGSVLDSQNIPFEIKAKAYDLILKARRNSNRPSLHTAAVKRMAEKTLSSFKLAPNFSRLENIHGFIAGIKMTSERPSNYMIEQERAFIGQKLKEFSQTWDLTRWIIKKQKSLISVINTEMVLEMIDFIRVMKGPDRVQFFLNAVINNSAIEEEIRLSFLDAMFELVEDWVMRPQLSYNGEFFPYILIKYFKNAPEHLKYRLRIHMENKNRDSLETINLLRDISQSGHHSLGFLLVKWNANNRSNLRDIVASKDIDLRIRVSAAGLLIEHYDMYEKFDLQEIEGFFREITGRRDDQPVNFDSVINALQGPLGQEELRVMSLILNYWLRESAFGQRIIKKEAARQKMFRKAAKATLERAGHKANSNHEYSVPVIKNIATTGEVFLMIVAHEIGHQILFYDKNFSGRSLNDASIHEWYADLFALAFSEKMGFKTSEYMEALRIVNLKGHKPEDDGFPDNEEHWPSRRQLKDILDLEQGSGSGFWMGLFMNANKAIKSGRNFNDVVKQSFPYRDYFLKRRLNFTINSKIFITGSGNSSSSKPAGSEDSAGHFLPASGDAAMLTAIKQAKINLIKEIARDGYADIRPFVDLVRKTYPEFDPKIPKDRWASISEDRDIVALSSALLVQIFLPLDEIFLISSISKNPEFLKERIIPGSWKKLDYLKGQVWIGESQPIKGGHENGGWNYGWFVITHVKMLQELGRNQYALLRHKTLTPAGTHTSPYKALMRQIIQESAVSEEDFVNGIGVELFRQEEIQHAKDNSYLIQMGRLELGDPGHRHEIFVSELVRKESSLQQRIVSHLEQEGDEGAKRINHFGLLNTLVEYSGRLGGAVEQMKMHLEANREDLAFLSFLNFIDRQISWVEKHDTVRDFDIPYVNVAILLLQDIQKWIGENLDYHSEDLMRKLGMEPGKLPVRKALQMLEEIYAGHFYTDVERLERVSDEFKMLGPDYDGKLTAQQNEDGSSPAMRVRITEEDAGGRVIRGHYRPKRNETSGTKSPPFTVLRHLAPKDFRLAFAQELRKQSQRPISIYSLKFIIHEEDDGSFSASLSFPENIAQDPLAHSEQLEVLKSTTGMTEEKEVYVGMFFADGDGPAISLTYSDQSDREDSHKWLTWMLLETVKEVSPENLWQKTDFLAKTNFMRALMGPRYALTSIRAQKLLDELNNNSVGGIDLNPVNMDLETRGDGTTSQDFNFSPAEIEQMRQDLNGLTPVIINIQPVMNLPLLLGLDDTPDGYPDGQYVKHMDLAVLKEESK